MQIVNAPIQSVTVYPQQAQIYRKTQAPLKAGMQTLSFQSLSPQLDSNSVQVFGDERLLLHDIRTEKVQLQKVAHEKQEQLKQYEKELLQKKEVMEARLQRLQKEQDLIEGLGKRVGTATENSDGAEWSPEKWKKILEFYSVQLEKIDQDRIKLRRDLQSLAEELDQLKRQIGGLGHGVKVAWQVQVQVEATAEGNYEVGLSYLVQQASWTPLYDLRVNSEEQSVGLSYKAKVLQNTGEDWKEVALSLSTSRPSIGGTPPELRPQFVRPYQPPKPLTRGVASPDASAMVMSASAPEGGRSRSAKKSAPRPKMKERAVVVEEQLIAARFHLEGAYTIKSDNQGQRVSLGQFSLSAKFQYLAVPRLQAKAYLQAEMTNDSPFTLLPGKGSVFLDGHFVAQTRLDSVAIGETFTQGLGVDEGIKVAHELKKRFRKSQGLMSKRDRQTFLYQIELTNHKKRSIEIEVQDRYPFSQDEQIKVELVEPPFRNDTDELSRSKQNVLKWTFSLNPGEERELLLEYAVSFPEGMRVEGL